MGIFEFQKDILHAVRTINYLIDRCTEHGGAVFMVEKDNPDFSVKLRRPIDILSYERIGGNDGTTD